MDYSVALADSAKTDADLLYARIAAAAPLRGPIWFEELLQSVRSLHRMPHAVPALQSPAKSAACYLANTVTCIESSTRSRSGIDG